MSTCYVNGSKLRNMVIPLPPLAEQHRIVAKVDELMALCDRLEVELAATQTKMHPMAFVDPGAFIGTNQGALLPDCLGHGFGARR